MDQINTITSKNLVAGEWYEGSSTFFTKTGRVRHSSTWGGYYVGIQNPDPSDPFIDPQTGYAVKSDPIHLFRDGHMGGVKQGHFGFPVDRFDAYVVA
ncbi:MAG: hypothetical protein ACTH0C_12745 [Actinomycetaceae bacterium]